MTDLTGAVWRTSSRSNDQGLCVEVATNVVTAHGVVGYATRRTRAGRRSR